MNMISLSSEILPWLADVALQATLLLALPGLAVLFMPKMAAARKHLILAASLAGIPMLMLCTGLMPDWRLLELRQSPAPSSREGAVSSVPATPSQSDPFAATVMLSPQGLHQVPVSGPANDHVTLQASMNARSKSDVRNASFLLTLFVWLAGGLAGGLALAVTWLRLRAMQGRLAMEGDPRLQSLLNRCLDEAGIVRGQVTLLRGKEGSVPMTWGMFGARFILLPHQACQWNDERLLLVLRHETGHISRKDVPVSLATTLCTLLLWFHPLAWWTLGTCNAAREAACDDLALQRGEAPPEAMAEELLAVVVAVGGGRRQRLFLPPALAMAAASKAALKRRLAALLDPDQGREGWSARTGPGMIGAIMGLAVLLSGLSACREAKPAGAAAVTAAKAPQVYIACKVFSIPATAAVLDQLQLNLPPHSGLGNLGIMDSNRAGELLKKVAGVKGASLMSTPSVTTRSGQRATIEVVREFIYPTEFDPPQIPQTKDGTEKLTLVPGENITVTPTTPTAFEMRPVGVRMEVEPMVDDAGNIDLSVSPEVTSFSGFINYGTPIKASSVGPDGKVQQTTLTENVINQPVFHTAKMTTQVTLPSGSSVVMGGLSGPENSDAKTLPEILKPDMTTQASIAGLKSERSDRLIFFIIEAKVVKP